MLTSIMTFDEPMINHTTFGIGGPAGCLVYPDNRDELIKLPGVGRKTANVILNTYFNKPFIWIPLYIIIC